MVNPKHNRGEVHQTGAHRSHPINTATSQGNKDGRSRAVGSTNNKMSAKKCERGRPN